LDKVTITMAFPQRLDQLCTPSYVYFIISVVGLGISIFQNIGNTDRYTLGSFTCLVPNTLIIFMIKVLYILFWTWILNLICRDGHSKIAWLLVLFPFLLLFVILGIIMINRPFKSSESMTTLHPAIL